MGDESSIHSAPSNSTTTTPTLTTINAIAQLPLKLTSNFLSWRAQFNALLLGYDLISYVDGSTPYPAESSTVTRTFWIHQDQLLLHVILASVSDQVISLIAYAKTSKQAWDKLTTLYANKAHARVLALKERLTLMHRDTKSVVEFLQAVKAIIDELSLIDVPLFDDDVVLHVLNGVGPDFKEIVAVIRARDTSISFKNLYDKLIEHEALLQRDDFVHSSSIVTANVAQNSRSFNCGSRPWNSSNDHSSSSNHTSHHGNPPPSHSRGYSGSFTGSNNSNTNRCSSTGYRGFC
ncbi:uncharacterized protein LOC110761548 [Prunus avium]|uniref:Uncharacterized protein LOC110761548 n=1 Tax=Prunus avium TaxID=42229 RepID=A0A6P5T0T3_PRUAV|nr:uncharacterized protein LOC110761548 [Prunus avium]